MPLKSPTLSEMASAIQEHLLRLEKDPTVNYPRKFDPKVGWTQAPLNTPGADTLFQNPSAEVHGRTNIVTYHQRYASARLTRSRAETYLNWLNQGGVGTHMITGVK